MRIPFALRHPASVLALAASALAQEASQAVLRDGDRVLLLGDALLERETTFGDFETRMHEQFPEAKFSVRNLSWSGETPRGWARASFDAPDKGFARLKEQIAAAKPTVAVLGFGMAASLQEITDRSGDILLNRDAARYGEEPMSAPRFKKELGELMTAIAGSAAGTPPPRFILLSPIRHEDLRSVRPGLPDPAPHNALLDQYAKAIEDLAKERGAIYVPAAATRIAAGGQEAPGTENGIHLSPAGHRGYFDRIAVSLKWNTTGWAKGNRAEVVRAAVRKKNDLFFHQTRPANSTYLFGFRKHEQGRNAAEIPQFDPLIAAADEAIWKLKMGGDAAVSAPEKPAPADSTPQPVPAFSTSDGLEMTLWADTRLVGKPVGMNWDSAGRLWVACSPVYPQITPGGHPEDKVVVIEDTDRDGKADKSTTFASGLLIAAGVAPDPGGQRAPNGAYVASSTELLHLADTDGDGKADTRRIVLSGFGTEDTHHTLHTVRWGPDHRLYFNQSIYIHSHLETPWGMVRLNSAGICAYDPRTERVDVHAKGWCNPWGHVWDSQGQEFVTDGAGYQGVSWLIPGAMYFTYENARRICPSVSPGSYPKFCGLELIQSPVFPADWQGNAITCDFRAHRIVRFQINDLAARPTPADRRAGYVTKELAAPVTTTDATFRPIDVKHGPDGALYFADWTNPIINHGEVDFRDPRRDHTNGRIWRLAPKGSAALPWGSFPTAVKAAIPEGRDPKTAAEKIHSPNPRVRVEAMRALSRIPAVGSAALVLEAAVNAPGKTDPVAALPGKPAAQFDNATASETADTHYAYAAWLSVNDLAPQVIEWIEQGAGAPNRDAMISYALQTLPAEKTASLLTRIIAKNGVPKDGSGPWIELIGSSGGPAECRILLDALLAATIPDGDNNPPLADGKNKFTAKDANRRAAAALVAAARRGVKPANPPYGGWQFHFYAPAECGPDAMRLAGLWKVNAPAALAGRISKGERPEMLDAVFETMRTLGTEEAAQVLGAFLAPRLEKQIDNALLRSALENSTPAIRRRALGALAAFRPQIALAALQGVLDESDEPARLPLWRELFASEKFTAAWLAKPAALSREHAAAALRAARELGKKGEKLAAALTPLAGDAPAPMPQDFAALVTQTKANGNPVEGEAVYRRAALACTVCHAIGGAGGKVGPDLTTIGASAPLDYVIESVLVPAAKVKEGFHAVALTLKGGRAATGVVARETDKDILLRDAIGMESTVVKADITARENIGSLMPAGLVQQLPPREQLHLFAFLAALGKPGPFDATKSTVARTWEIFSGKDVEAVVGGKAQKPGAKVLTNVDGRLLKAALGESLQAVPDTGDTIVAVARFSAASAAKARLHLQGATKAWLDGAPLAIASDPNPVVDLAPGPHTFAVKLDVKSLPESLRIECADARFE